MISIESQSHKAWGSTSSSDTHHMVAINRLIKKTSLLEVRLLTEVLKARENDLLRIQPIFASPMRDFRSDLHNVGMSVLPPSPGPTPPSSARLSTQWRTDNSISEISRAGDEKAHLLSKSLPPLEGRTRRAQGLVTQQNIPLLQVLREEHEALPQPYPISTIHSGSARSVIPDLRLLEDHDFALTQTSPTSTPDNPLAQSTLLLLQNEKNLISMVQLNLLRLTIAPEYCAPLTKVQPRSTRKRRVSKFPFEDAGPDALSDWLHALRLHKYVENLKGMTTAELLGLDEEELQRRGVGTVGARTKLLRALKEARDSLDAEKNS